MKTSDAQHLQSIFIHLVLPKVRTCSLASLQGTMTLLWHVNPKYLLRHALPAVQSAHRSYSIPLFSSRANPAGAPGMLGLSPGSQGFWRVLWLHWCLRTLAGQGSLLGMPTS